jgi:flagellar basal-body rod protein FlgB
MAAPIFDSKLAGLRQILDLRMQQHGLVSANLANANTPQFQAKRVDFKVALDQVMAGGSAADLRRTSGRHFAGLDNGPAPVETIEAPAWAEDGNSVNPDEEMFVLMENNLLFNATVEAMNRKLALLEYAASDGGK